MPDRGRVNHATFDKVSALCGVDFESTRLAEKPWLSDCARCKVIVRRYANGLGSCLVCGKSMPVEAAVIVGHYTSGLVIQQGVPPKGLKECRGSWLYPRGHA